MKNGSTYHLHMRHMQKHFLIVLASIVILSSGYAENPSVAVRDIPTPSDTAFVTHRNGRAVITQNGSPVPAPAYCDYIMRQGAEAWRQRIEEFVHSGATVFMLNVPHGKDFFDSHFWTDDNTYPIIEPNSELFIEPNSELSMDKQAKLILELQPRAHFYVRTWISPPLTWVEKHPGEVQTDEDGKTYRQASISSPLYI